MEELNDVEFGSDKSTEEAPILVAQRYLNIFRQIHIFNKDKRTQFDDELLALPQNITDFFKRMPGGRLLVEHIEDVKTERGISFVKSNKEDFTDSNGLSTPAVQNNDVSAGNMVMDASFAEALAASMASAFKQVPTQTAASGTDTTILTNLNRTFQLIAEEIQMSRSSLLEVLKETRQITDSVISSQLAISRLLEKLCNESAHISVMPQRKAETNENAQSHPEAVNINRDNNRNTVLPQVQSITSDTSNISTGSDNIKKKKKKKKHNNPQELPAQNNTSAQPLQHPATDMAIKSEKIAPAFSGIIRNVASKHNDDFTNVQLDEPSFEDMPFTQYDDTFSTPVQPDFRPQNIAAAEDINSVPSESETFIKDPIKETDAAGRFDDLMDNEANFIPSDTESDAIQNIPESEMLQPSVSAEGIDDFLSSDGLEFALPEQGVSFDEQTQEPEQAFQTQELNRLPDSDGLDYALPKQNNMHQKQLPEQDVSPFEGLDSLISGDGLDFALPEQSTAVEEPEQEQAEFNGLDSLISSDGLDFALPEQNTDNEEATFEPTRIDSLDTLTNSDGLDFALPEQNTAFEEAVSESAGANELDSLITFEPETDFIEEAQQPDNNIVADVSDNFIAQDNPVSPIEQHFDASQQSQEPQHSRYSEELDKIRAALTSDNVDISSLDQPIAIDDYSDDENVGEDEVVDFSSNLDAVLNTQPATAETLPEEEEWEWEYVDEDGNPIEGSDGEGEDWEWEYVEDDGQENVPDNNNK